MKILIIDDNSEVRELITFMVESNFRAHALIAGSSKDAVKRIAAHPDLSAIICNYDLPDGQAEEIYRFVLSLPKPVPFIACTSQAVDSEELSLLAESPPAKLVLQPDVFPGIQEALFQIMKERGEDLITEEYCKIRTPVVAKLGLLHCDLYVKLNDTKYIKVMREGDFFDSADHKRYEAKKIDYLYLKTTDAKSVLEDIAQDLVRMAETRLISLNNDTDVYTNSIDLIAGFNQSLGFSLEAQKLAQASVKLALKTVRRNPKLSVLYSKLSLDPENYLASHSVTLAHLTCGLASLMGWVSDTTFYKLTLASFLHDLSLPSDALSRIHRLQELGGHDFTLEDQKKYRDHPENSALLLEELTDIPADVSEIIQQHHERPSGQGFPAGLDHNSVHPLAALFIVAEDLIEFRTKISSDEHLSYFVNNLQPGFHKGNFKPVVDALINSLLDSAPNP